MSILVTLLGAGINNIHCGHHPGPTEKLELWHALLMAMLHHT